MGDNSFKTGNVCPRCGADTFDQTGPASWICRDKDPDGTPSGGCGRPLSSPVWTYRRGPNGEPLDVEFNGKTLTKISFRLRMASRPDEALPVIADENNIPRILFAALRTQIEERYRLGQDSWIQLDNNRRITFSEEAVCITMDTSNGDKVWKVIRKPFEIVRRVKVDDQWLVVVRDLSGEFSGTVEQVHKRLSANAQVLSHRDIKDIINHLISASASISTGQFTYGVFQDEDRLEVPEFIHPRTEFQKEVFDQVKKHLGRVPTPADYDAYARFFEKYLPYEWMPAAALTAISPIGFILRKARIIVPGVLHYSQESGIGKTTVALACTTKVWGAELVGAEGFGGGNGFRFLALFDAITVARTVDEAEKLDWDKLGGMMKQFFESDVGSIRGTKDQGMVKYDPLANFIFTMNAMPALSRPLLARLLVVLFNEERAKAPVEAKLEVDRLFDSLNPIGSALTRAALKLCGGQASRLLALIRDHDLQITSTFRDFNDNRRSKSWGALYFGLKVWEECSGGRLKAPTIAEFIAQVIEPVEGMTRRATMDPLSLFRDFTQQYIARESRSAPVFDGRNRTEITEVRGDGILFQHHIWDAPRVSGYLVSKAFLDLYNDKFAKRVEAQIPDLPRLARLVSNQYPIKLSDLTQDGGRSGRQYKFGVRNVRAVFVPDQDPNPATQGRLPSEDETPSDPPQPPSVWTPISNGNGAHAEPEDTFLLTPHLKGHP